MASDVFEEAIELQGMTYVVRVDRCHGIPLHAKAVENAQTLHDSVVCRSAAGILSIHVVLLVRAVDAYSNEPVVLPKEPSPFFCNECSIGLNAVVYTSSPRIFAL